MGFRYGSLLRIVILGAVIAGGYWVVRAPSGEGSDDAQVVVTRAVVAHEHARWVKQWGRPPTAAELRTSLDAYVKDEILYREALARDMDRADPRVRLALIQKMQMLASGRAARYPAPQCLCWRMSASI